MLLLLSIKSAKAQTSLTYSSLPIVIIETYEQEITDEPKIICHMRTVYNTNGTLNYISGPYNFSGRISIEIRGNTSQSYPKKQYLIETQKYDGSNNNVQLLGLPDENDWILSAPYSDKTLIRNVLAYQIFSSFSHYSPRTMCCELVINNTYQGLYVLTEKIKVDKNRLSTIQYEDNDSSFNIDTDGFLLQIDRPSFDPLTTFYTSMHYIGIEIEFPKSETITQSQSQIIKSYINDFESRLFSNSFLDTTLGYKELIDLNTFIDYFIINELAKNIDAYKLSTYLYKNNSLNGGKLCFGPAWDFNIAFGNADYSKAYSTEGFIANNHPWWNRILQDSFFQDSLNNRWFELREDELSNENLLFLIDSLYAMLEEPQKRDSEKWDNVGKRSWPNYYVGRTYDNEIDFLKSWIINRLNWLDLNMPGNKNENNYTVKYDIGVFPNPFNYFFTYVFHIENESNINIYLFDANGKYVGSIIENQTFSEGKHMIPWNAFINGNLIPSNFYIIVLEVEGEIVAKTKIIKKM